jgi:hypothetical protein
MEAPNHALRNLLVALGCCLLVAGAVLLLWFGQVVYQIVTEPEKVRIIQYIMEHVSTEGPIITGSAAESSFEVTLSDSAKAFGFFFLGVLALGVLAGIVKALLSGGVEVIRGALAIQAFPVTGETPQSKQRVYLTRKG